MHYFLIFTSVSLALQRIKARSLTTLNILFSLFSLAGRAYPQAILENAMLRPRFNLAGKLRTVATGQDNSSVVGHSLLVPPQLIVSRNPPSILAAGKVTLVGFFVLLSVTLLR